MRFFLEEADGEVIPLDVALQIPEHKDLTWDLALRVRAT